jgi:hypothetical protein
LTGSLWLINPAENLGHHTKLKKKLHKLKMMMLDPFNVNLKHQTQEYIKWFNRIIPLTTYLGVFKEG